MKQAHCIPQTCGRHSRNAVSIRRSFYPAVAGIAILATITGCHSAFVQTTILNQGPTVRTVEIDYPSQSFGTEILNTNQAFHYRFKVQGSGQVKLLFMDDARKMHTAKGPTLSEGAEGNLSVTITPAGNVNWSPLIAPANKP